ncbi:MAG: tetratricopeptide repeat protein [Deltaproteobacteria bacterium]|nr:tetratricopeptide repeat protein [Deltaproteobacteria bacterium]
MASKDKLLANAQKFLSKGQTQKAIGEYQKLVDAFPKDVRNRQKFAELLCRNKRNEDALKEYEVVARHYTETGFYLKAIAVFKQMQKIESSRVDIYYRLAELNEKQGLIGNALTEYRNLISFYEKNQMHQEAIEVLEKMAELDPGNLNVLAKVAECYMTIGQNDQALEKFQELIAPLSEKGEHAKVIKLYEHFLDICPEEGPSRLPLANALVGNGAADKAISVLKDLLKHSPEDLEINRSLADAYVASQDFANARLTLKHLLKINQGDLDLREYYVRVCIDFGELERARDRLESWKDAFSQAGRTATLKGLYEELKESLPDDVVVSGTLAAIYETVGATPNLDDQGATAAASTVAEETADDAVFDLAIDDVQKLDMDGEDADPDIEVPSPDVETTAPDLQAEKVSAVDVLLDLELEAPGAESVDATMESESVPVEDDDVEMEVEIDFDDMGELALDFDDYFAEDSAAGVTEEEAKPDDLLEPDDLEDLEEIDQLEELEELEEIEGLEILAEREEVEELEEAQFYLQQGLFDDATRVVQTLLESFPDLPELHAKMDQINQERQTAEEASESSDFVDLMADLRENDLLEATGVLDSLDADTLVDEDLAQKTVSELDSADTESHFNLGIAYKEMGLYDDAIAEFDKASQDPSRAIDCITLTGQCHSEVGAMESAMESFKKGLAMDNLNDESRMALNFELGMLYQMNGQLLEALEIFQLVAEKDSFFRNVSELIKNLRRELGLGNSDDDGPQGDRDRVSYV